MSHKIIKCKHKVNIDKHVKTVLENGKLYCFSPKEIREISASQFKTGDEIKVSKYLIHIKYGKYNTPSFHTWVEDYNTFKRLDCTPGCDIPYYIDSFIGR